MARAWITDRWVKDTTVDLPDGTTIKVSPTPAQLRALKSLPEHFRTSKFGKGSRWVAGWYEPGGKQRQKLFARQVDAEAFIASLEDDIRSDRYIDPSQRERPFREVAEAWLKSKKRIKGSSKFRYRSELDRYVLPKWGDWIVGNISREHIDDWISELQAGTAPHVFDSGDHLKKKRAPRPMSPSYLRHVAGATFGGPLRYAVAEQWIGRNPLARVELPREEVDLESDLPSLSYGDIEALADTALDLTENPSDPALIRTLSSSGPRIGEASGLKIKDLDLENTRARIHRTWTVDEHGKRTLGSVKTWEKRWLPLAEHAAEEIARITHKRDPEDFVFLSPRGQAIDGRNWRNRVWEKTKTAAGLVASYSVHDLRHVAATNAIRAGADVKLVQRMLGHKDATETLNTYSHLWPDRVSEVMTAIETQRKKALGLEDDENDSEDTEAAEVHDLAA